MLNSFLIYSHPILPLLVSGNIANPDFLTTWEMFHIENRISNVSGITSGVPGRILCQLSTGSIGGEGLQNQNRSIDANLFLPKFQNSEAEEKDIALLRAGQRMTFTYENVDPGQEDYTMLQSSFLGHRETGDNPRPVLERPFTYYSRDVVVPAVALNGTPGQAVTEITISPFFAGPSGLFVRAFLARTHGFGNIAVSIRDKATGYVLMNTPTMLENFTYDFSVESNFRPYPFSPWIAPKGHSYEITFFNFFAEDQTCNLAFWGNLCSYTE